MSELEKLEEFIRVNFRTKEKFATAIGCTRQTISHNLRLSRKSKEQKLSSLFKYKIQKAGIDFFAPFDKNEINKPSIEVQLLQEVIAKQQLTIETLTTIVDRLTQELSK